MSTMMHQNINFTNAKDAAEILFQYFEPEAMIPSTETNQVSRRLDTEEFHSDWSNLTDKQKRELIGATSVPFNVTMTKPWAGSPFYDKTYTETIHSCTYNGSAMAPFMKIMAENPNIKMKCDFHTHGEPDYFVVENDPAKPKDKQIKITKEFIGDFDLEEDIKLEPTCEVVVEQSFDDFLKDIRKEFPNLEFFSTHQEIDSSEFTSDISVPEKVYTQLVVDTKADADKLLKTYFDMSDAQNIYENNCETTEEKLDLKNMNKTGCLDITKFMCSEDRDNPDIFKRAMNGYITPSCVYAKTGLIGTDMQPSDKTSIQMTTLDGAPVPVILQIMQENPDMHISATWTKNGDKRVRSIEHDPSKDKYEAFINQTMIVPEYDENMNPLTEFRVEERKMSLATAKDDLNTSFPAFVECYEKRRNQLRSLQAESVAENTTSVNEKDIDGVQLT